MQILHRYIYLKAYGEFLWHTPAKVLDCSVKVKPTCIHRHAVYM